MADHRWMILNAALAVGDGDVGLARADGARQGLPDIVYQQPLWLALSAELDTDLLLTLIQLAENEVLRNEGEAYARELDDAGADVTNVRYNGTIHDFALLNALLDVPQHGHGPTAGCHRARLPPPLTSWLGWPLTSRRTTGATTEQIRTGHRGEIMTP